MSKKQKVRKIVESLVLQDLEGSVAELAEMVNGWRKAYGDSAKIDIRYHSMYDDEYETLDVVIWPEETDEEYQKRLAEEIDQNGRCEIDEIKELDRLLAKYADRIKIKGQAK